MGSDSKTNFYSSIVTFYTWETGNRLWGQNLEKAMFVYILKQELGSDN